MIANQSKSNYLPSATQFLERYNPIPTPECSTQCSICLETVEEDFDKQWTTLVCGHTFHRECLYKWFVYSQTCPHCRNPISLSESVTV